MCESKATLPNFKFVISGSGMTTLKMANGKFKLVAPERQALQSWHTRKTGFVFHERFIYYFCSDFTYYTARINESYIYMHIFSEAVPLAPPSSALFGIIW